MTKPFANTNPSVTDALAYYMFQRQANTYEVDPHDADQAWRGDPLLRQFWQLEAAAAIGFIDQWREAPQ